jgi:hypothetical protein
MPTIDLSTPPHAPATLLDGLPRRVTLTLPELRLVADRAGGAPLPFELAAPRGSHALEDRLGTSRATTEDSAYAAALASLHDPEETLARRGLLGEVGGDTALVGAVGLLATPQTALDLDVTAAGIRARAWHRRAGDAVATLSTVDGIVFELAWFPTSRWAEELGRAAVLPEECGVTGSAVPSDLDLPFGLADAAAEALRSGRGDLLPVLVQQADGAVLDASGQPVAEGAAARVLTALSSESRGRLRVLVADLTGEETTVVGVVSWTLLADGWHALRPREVDGRHRVRVTAVDPDALATELAPVLAEVTA